MRLLEESSVLMHGFVIGEIAMGNLIQRDIILGRLRKMKHADSATDKEVLDLVERERLYGLGIGYVDAHLLAATRLTSGARLWTRDKRLAAAAANLGLAVS